MARYRGPRLRKCRRLDFAVFESPKFSNPRRNYVPGQHGPGQRIKLSNYGIQLREKQRIKYSAAPNGYWENTIIVSECLRPQ